MIKAKKLLLLLLAIMLVATSSTAMANYRFFSSVQMVCSAYRINVNYEDMNLMYTGDNSKEFSLTLESARNDFDRVMLIGFYAAGKAMLKYEEPIETVSMIIGMEYKGTEKIFATAEVKDIIKYVKKEYTSSQFMRKIKFN